MNQTSGNPGTEATKAEQATFLMVFPRSFEPLASIQDPISSDFKLAEGVKALAVESRSDSTIYLLGSLEDLVECLKDQFDLYLDEKAMQLTYPATWRIFQEGDEFVLMDEEGDMRVYRRKITRNGAVADEMTFTVKRKD